MAAKQSAAVEGACTVLPRSRAMATQLPDYPSSSRRSITDTEIFGNTSTKPRSIYTNEKSTGSLFSDPRPAFDRTPSLSISAHTDAPRPSNPSEDTTREALSVHIKDVDHGANSSLHDETGDPRYAQTLDIDNEGTEDTERRHGSVLLQCWVYETEDSRLTFAEKLEKFNWETSRLEKL
ncbi:uncharacterized protein PAC_12415 [Phialocephala subalpina]|uniref:Uncharacterized protein n=1 Tax=Phialocephala subalpina TaxID=576137 RepID=A0A1L7XBW8_9HELO|nr:uncharacterized protein PAC_12415 [Phialocephala subalpina]